MEAHVRWRAAEPRPAAGRRARITPEQAGLPGFGKRRVPGLRCEESRNTNAPSFIIGERAADFVSGDRGSAPASAAAAG